VAMRTGDFQTGAMKAASILRQPEELDIELLPFLGEVDTLGAVQKAPLVFSWCPTSPSEPNTRHGEAAAEGPNSVAPRRPIEVAHARVRRAKRKHSPCRSPGPVIVQHVRGGLDRPRPGACDIDDRG